MKSVKVIDLRDVQTSVLIDSGNVDSLRVSFFKIGHSNNASETFVPNIQETDDYLYIDMAGMLDSRGDTIDVLNCFMNKQVFSLAKSVKFIIPIIMEQLTAARGMEIVRQIKVIINLCGDNKASLIDSVQPVLLKCKPSADDDFDLDEIKSDLMKVFENLTKTEKNQTGISQIINRGQKMPPELQLINSEIEQTQDFLVKFAEKLILYDPMDRPIPNEDNNWATPRKDFLDILNKMPPAPTKNVNMPISNELFRKVDDQIRRTIWAISQESEKNVNMAKERGSKYSRNEGGLVVDLDLQLDCLKFFAVHELFKDSRLQYVRARDMLEQNIIEIERAKIYGDSNLYQ